MSKAMALRKTLNDAIDAVRCVPMQAARTAEYADLAGEYAADAYRSWDDHLQALAVAVAEAQTELRRFQGHTHDWNDDDRCAICGADGLA